MNDIEQRAEALGPAERIIQTLTAHSDHMVHNRPGVVAEDGRTVTGVRWNAITWKMEGEEGAKQKVVYRLDKNGTKTNRVRIGIMGDDGVIRDGARVVGRYQPPGIFQEVAVWMYKQIADVWKMDQEFVARWASYSFAQEHRDMKVVLAAFMLVQDRYGAPEREGDEILFYDTDYREVGEAMVLIRRRDKRDLNPKLLLRVGDVLMLPGVAEINRDLGFGRSARNPAMGRYHKVVEKYLRQRERNPAMLEGLIKNGFKTSVQKLARRVGYKPETEVFFKLLRWKQKQAEDGRRMLAIGEAVEAAESWEGLSENDICQRIITDKPNYKRIVGLLPKEVGLTRAIMAAAIEAGSVSNADLIILSPTLEDLGLLKVPEIEARWKRAIEAADNMRAANIAARMKRREHAEVLETAADNAVKAAVEEVTRGLRLYVGVDVSSSMAGAIEQAKRYLPKLLMAFPQDKLTVAVFNTAAHQITIPHPSSKGVEAAFRGIRAYGGTSYGVAVRDVFDKPQNRPAPDEDVLIFWIGDQQDGMGYGGYTTLADFVRRSSLDPVAFGMLHVGGFDDKVYRAAADLGIPCFAIDEGIFEDCYAISRTLRNLIAATPVGKAAAAPAARVQRNTLVQQILRTDLLTKPAWA